MTLLGYPLPSAVKFRRATSELLGGPPTVRVVMRNFPPAIVMTWTKGH